MKKAFLAVFVILVIGSLIVAGCAKPPQTTSPPATTPPPAVKAPEPLVIGSVGGRTGWGGAYMAIPMDFKFAYEEYVNATGGINGRPIKVVEYDDACDPEQTNVLTNKLIELDKALVITGPVWTDSVLAAISANKGRVPQIMEFGYPADVVPAMFQPGSRVFTVDAYVLRYVTAALKYLKDEFGVKKLAVLMTTNQSGKDHLVVTKEAAAALGIEIVLEESIDPAAIDAMPQLTKMKAANPDAVYMAGSGNVIGPIMKAIKTLGMNIPVGAGDGYVTQETVALVKGYEPEILVMPCTTQLTVTVVTLPPDHPLVQVSNRMWDIWSAKYGETKGTKAEFLMGWSAWTMDSMDLAAQGIKLAGPLPDDTQAARDAINEALENKIKGFQQLAGERTMTPTDHVGLDVSGAGVILVTIKDGKFIALER